MTPLAGKEARRVAKPRERLFRRLAGQFEVEGVSTEFDLIVPRDRTMGRNVDPLKDSAVVPGPEYSPPREIQQVDFARGPVRKPEPDSQSLARLDLQRSNHLSLSKHRGWLQSLHGKYDMTGWSVKKSAGPG